MTTSSKPLSLSAFAGIVAFNVFPIIGVWYLGWKSFDLIFLYWFENVIIGVFTVLRFLVRPYQHPLDILRVLLFVPFFTFHYGMFCTVHGIFVMMLFGKGYVQNMGHDLMDVYAQAFYLLHNISLMVGALSLLALQAFYWIYDIVKSGFGDTDLKQLMVAPYRRIVILHLSIIGSGFALAFLNEPLSGLILLVVLKTTMDVYFWRHDKEKAAMKKQPFNGLTEEDIKKIEERFREPMMQVNGQEVRFDSYADMKASANYRTMISIMRMLGKASDVKRLEAYMNMKIREEQAG